MFVAVFFYQRAAFQILEGDIKQGHRDLFLFPTIEGVAGSGFDNPVFKCLDNSYFKVMQASV